MITHRFRLLTDELLSISSRYSLSNRHFKPLLEEELIIGSITQKTSQPTLRKEKMIKIRDATEFASRRVRDALEGNDERTPRQYLRYAWAAWMFSLREMGKRTFGAQSFWWIAAGAVFDAMKKIEDVELVGTSRFSKDWMILSFLSHGLSDAPSSLTAVMNVCVYCSISPSDALL